MSTARPSAPRSGFTLIELVVVVGVLIAGSTVAVSGVFSALRGNAVEDAVRTVELVCRAAQDHARQADVRAIAAGQPFQPGWRYGVVLVDARGAGRTPWVGLTYGPAATAEHLLLDAAGEPVLRRELPRLVGVLTGSSSSDLARLSPAPGATGEVGWMFQYGTGWLTLEPTRHLRPTFVGVDPARIAATGLPPAICVAGPALIALATPDRSTVRSIELFPVGALASRAVR